MVGGPPAEGRSSDEDQARLDCRSNLENLKTQYRLLFAERKFWTASSEIRRCAGLLDEKGLHAMVSEAEKQSYLQDINDPGTQPFDKARAIEALVREHPEDGSKYAGQVAGLYAQAEAKARNVEAARRKGQGVHIGMTADEVVASSWGKPDNVNRTTYAWGVKEQWVYSTGFLYLTNGRLEAIQERH
jgi:hypothetical protein